MSLRVVTDTTGRLLPSGKVLTFYDNLLTISEQDVFRGKNMACPEFGHDWSSFMGHGVSLRSYMRCSEHGDDVL